MLPDSCTLLYTIRGGPAMKILNKLKKLVQISITKTIRFNFHYFGWGGVLHPCILITHNVKIVNLGGSVEVKDSSIGAVRIGFFQVGTEDIRFHRTIWNNTGKIVFEGRAKVGSGTRISNNGEIIFGENFVVTSNSTFISQKRIAFGKNCLVSWECLFMDTDFHKIYSDANNDEQINPDCSILIGSNVWIGCRTTVLKGTEVSGGNVIDAGSVLHGHYSMNNAIIDGNRIIKNNIRWED